MENDQTLKNAMNEWARVTKDPQMLVTYEVNQKFQVDETLTLKKAEKQGEERAIKRVALKMLQKGIDIQTISELTELTEKEIEQIRQ
ncbi:hypothetical protein SFC34_19695 [Priestia aryabhattai]|uniref:hypothetical protein n=1 Tax=Priestia aryabhattai TaxID=412384 RepID=UPI0024528F9D|nr:hypothetical protein [Priestia aryabhattai]MDH3113475.1 hypothetical protein [Priestia aryabhattai]MDH3127621.1 hypothetical protein [Priestia aryabhattai]MED4156192.1 hypothetical protein [Priestia aryabhattai]